jgi:ferredoxin
MQLWSDLPMRIKGTVVRLALCLTILAAATGCMNGSPRAYLEVEKERCSGCMACGRVCIVDAIRYIDGKAVIDPSKCVVCGKCVEVCPTTAIY